MAKPVTYSIVIDNKAIDAKLKKARTVVKDFLGEFLIESGRFVVKNSPIDTGTYILNHQVGVNYQTNPLRITDKSSKGKVGYSDLEGPGYNRYAPRPERDMALQSIIAQVESLPDSGRDFWDRVTILNTSLHASKVEYDHGFAVYTRLRGAASQIAQIAAQRAKSK